MLVSQKIAIAAHLHVLLRRKTGRVTDTEWMAENADYAREIVRFSRLKAAEDKIPELGEWADKLESAMLEPSPATPKPLAQTALQMLKERNAAAAAAMSSGSQPPSTGGFGHSSSTFNDTGFVESQSEEAKPAKAVETGPRYVGGIR